MHANGTPGAYPAELIGNVVQSGAASSLRVPLSGSIGPTGDFHHGLILAGILVSVNDNIGVGTQNDTTDNHYRSGSGLNAGFQQALTAYRNMLIANITWPYTVAGSEEYVINGTVSYFSNGAGTVITNQSGGVVRSAGNLISLITEITLFHRGGGNINADSWCRVYGYRQ